MNESLTLVLDTNVLLGDPDALFAYPNATLILPLTVLDEMDQFKKEYNERGRNARVLALYLDQLRVQGSLTQGVPVGNGATLLVDLEEITPKNTGTMDKLDDRALWLAIRQALLMIVDAIERRYGLKRTAEMRKDLKSAQVVLE